MCKTYSILVLYILVFFTVYFSIFYCIFLLYILVYFKIGNNNLLPVLRIKYRQKRKKKCS